jgi:ribose 5-phosphate isomerase B
MKVLIGSDHRGFKLKGFISDYLRGKNVEVFDLGTHSDDPIDYPDIAFSLGEKISKGEADFGILICFTGVGMSIAANKVKGVRAANVCSKEMARLSRAHNNANILCLSAEFLNFDEVKGIVDVFLSTPFEGGRHKRRIEKIENFERIKI